MASTTIVLWNREAVYESPARKSFSVNWDGQLSRADLSVDVDPNFLLLFGKPYLDKIVVNGTEIVFQGDRNDVVSADLRMVLRKGINLIELYHNALPFWGIQTAGVYAYLVVESSFQFSLARSALALCYPASL